MAQTAKRTAAIREGVDREKLYPLEEAVKMVKERAKAKFDETIEVAMNLGVDPRHADQMVRGIVNLPNGSGRAAPRPTRRGPPGPTWSAPRTWWRRCRAAISISTAASRRPTSCRWSVGSARFWVRVA